MPIYYHAFQTVLFDSPAGLGKLLAIFKNPKTAWEKASEEHFKRVGFQVETVKKLKRAQNTLNLEAELEKLKKLKIDFLTPSDSLYPEPLKQIPDPPQVLYYRGSLDCLKQPCLAIVGTRAYSPYGKETALQFSRELNEAGFTIVSGLALGIDAFAHQGALEVRGKTIAVLGSALNQIFPVTNRSLARKILDGKSPGLIVSEYPPGIGALPHHFPLRNRIISGLCLGVLVIEARKKSGALITAQFALDQNREVFAVPGDIYRPRSRGCHALIQEGKAYLVSTPEEILEKLKGESVPKLPLDFQPETEEEAKIWEILNQDPKHIDEIIQDSSLSAALVSSTLIQLEVKGLVRNFGSLHYGRIK